MGSVPIYTLSPAVLATIVEFGRLIVGSAEVDVVLAAVADQVVSLIDCDGCGIWLRQGDAFTCRLARGLTTVDDDAPPLALVAARAATMAEVWLPEATETGTGALVAAPLTKPPVVAGALILTRRASQPFRPDDLATVEALAGLAAAALYGAALYQQTLQRASALSRLQEISLALNADLNPRQVLRRIVTAATNLTDALFTSVMLVDSVGVPHAYMTDDPLRGLDPLHEPDTPRPAGVTATILRTGQPVVVEDVQRDPTASPFVRNRGLGAFIGLPLLIEGRPIGLLWVNFAQPKRPTSDEIGLLTTLAAQAATALRNAHLYDEARRLADRDSLTNVANYRMLQESLRQHLAGARRHGAPLSIMMIDVNNFKRVNDSLGHLAGDAVLRSVASTLVATCRESDVVGRYGGDEFLVVLPNTDQDGANLAARRVLAQVISLPTSDGEAPPPISLAIGAATYPDEAQDIESLVAVADARLYANKPEASRRRPLVRPPGRRRRRSVGRLG